MMGMLLLHQDLLVFSFFFFFLSIYLIGYFILFRNKNPKIRTEFSNCLISLLLVLVDMRTGSRLGFTMGRKYKCLWKPSYVLKLCPKPYRPEHRRRLQYLLRRLVNQQDWVGASGVINVYLKGTLKDSSISKNRFKFWALLELLKHVGNHSKNLRRIENLYDVWSKKIGSLKIRSRKTWAVESRYAILLENMLFYLMQGDSEKAYQLSE